MIEPAQTQRLKIEPAEVRFWKNELEASEDFQKKEFLERQGYEKLIRLYESEHHSEGSNPLEITQQDEIYPGVSAIISGSLYQLPTINAKALHPDSDEVIQLPFSAQVAMLQYAQQYQNFDATYTDLMKAALEYAIKKHGLKLEAQMALFDLLSAGFCIIETNHMTQTETFQGADSSQGQGFMDKAKEVLDSAMEFVGVKTESEVEEDVASKVDDKGRDYTFDSTYIERWNPLDILFDYRAKVYKRSRYVAKKVQMTVAEFNASFPEFKGKVSQDSMKPLVFSKHQDSQNSKSITCYELQIKKKTGTCILKLAKGLQEELDYYELPFTTNGFTLKYGSIDKYGKLYPVSKLYRASKPQHELNHHLTIQTEHADRSLKKVAVFVGGLNQSGKQAVKSSDVYAIVEKEVPGPVFEPMPVGGTSPENEAIQMKMAESINKQIGANELSKSGQSDSKFATQDQLKQQSFEDNTSSVKDALGDVLKEVVNSLKDIIVQMWDGEDFFQITGKQGMQFWYRPEMGKLSDILIGDYDIDVDIVSAEKPNPMKERSEALELWQLLTAPQTQGFLMSKGKTLSLQALENVLKKYSVNPATVYEDAQPMALPPQMPSDPNASMSGNEVPGVAPQPGVPSGL